MEMLGEPFKINGVSRSWGEHIIELVNGPDNLDLLDNTCNNLKSLMVKGQKNYKSDKFMNANIAECTNAYIELNSVRTERVAQEIIRVTEKIRDLTGSSKILRRKGDALDKLRTFISFILTCSKICSFRQ
jgi:hypothetical protein